MLYEDLLRPNMDFEKIIETLRRENRVMKFGLVLTKLGLC